MKKAAQGGSSLITGSLVALRAKIAELILNSYFAVVVVFATVVAA